MGYTKHAIKGVSWMTALQTAIRLFTFVKIAVLARVLTPDQFGIFGIAALLLALLEILTETGINIILIQSKETIDKYLDSAWIASIIRGTLIALGIILLSPFIISFFNSPNALGIVLFISIAPFIKGFINPAEIIFQKELDFKKEFLFRTSLYFMDAIVAMIFALITHSVYSLALGLIVSAFLEVILSFVLIKQKPRFRFDKQYLREIFHKGKWVTGYSIFNYFGENFDNIVVGRLLGTSSLGVYQMAYRVAILPITEISDVVNKAMFPVYSKIQDDNKRLKSAYLKVTIISSVITVWVGLIIFLFPKQIIFILLGSKWMSAADVLRILAIFGILKSIISPSSIVFLAKSRQNYLAILLIVRFIVLLLTVIPFVIIYNLSGAAFSQIISMLVSIPLMIFLLYKVFIRARYT